MSQPAKQANVNQKSASIIKCGFIWKKGTGVWGKHYKERLFELKLTGKLDYYEVTCNGNKLQKGTITLSSGTILKRRTDAKQNEYKFVIKTKEREWYLWCQGNRAKTEIQEWMNEINKMIKSSHSTSPPNTNTNTNLNDNNANIGDNGDNNLRPTSTAKHVSQSSIATPMNVGMDHLETPSMNDANTKPKTSSDELFGDYETPKEIIIQRPTNPNTPFNPFYGGHIKASGANNSNINNENDFNMNTMNNTHNRQSHNPYYNAPIYQNNKNMMPSYPQTNNLHNASAPIIDDNDNDNNMNTMHNEFKSMDMNAMHNDNDNKNEEDVHFTIGPTVSLKSVLFHSWISYVDGSPGYLMGVKKAPMINERFLCQCVDPINQIYSVQAPKTGLYLSADTNGGLKFANKIYGEFEQWKIRYHHINKISLTSKYYNTHFGIDSNGYYHHRYKSITDIVLFEVSPPVILNKKESNKAISIHHWNESNSLAPTANTHIKYPLLPSHCIIAFGTNKGTFVGIENANSLSLRTDYTTCQSFDGELLARNQFIVHQDVPHQLYAFKSTLNNKWLSPSDKPAGGKIKFVAILTEKEYFNVLWHDVNIVSLLTYYGNILCINNNDNLLHDKLNNNEENKHYFEIKSVEINKLNKSRQNNLNIPSLQLPIRSVNGELKRDIWLKGHGADQGYLAFRSKPYRYEAVSKIMGNWETLRFKHDDKRNNNKHKCIVTLYTKNGMIIANDYGAQICFLTQDDQNDELRCRWRIYFHSHSLISIQNEKYKGWMCLTKHIKSNIYVLTMLNPQFDSNGKPVIDINNARMYKKINCQYELCPPSNVKDLQQQKQSFMFNNNHSNANLKFSM